MAALGPGAGRNRSLRRFPTALHEERGDLRDRSGTDPKIWRVDRTLAYRQRLRALRRHDDLAHRDRHRGESRWEDVAALRVSMEARRSAAAAAIRGSVSAQARLADVACGPRTGGGQPLVHRA